MNPFFPPAICLMTLAALAHAADDIGKASKPPANVVGQMLLAATASSTASVVVGTVVANAIIGNAYDTWLGRTTLKDITLA